jgi:hypothetical protein
MPADLPCTLFAKLWPLLSGSKATHYNAHLSPCEWHTVRRFSSSPHCLANRDSWSATRLADCATRACKEWKMVAKDCQCFVSTKERAHLHRQSSVSDTITMDEYKRIMAPSSNGNSAPLPVFCLTAHQAGRDTQLTHLRWHVLTLRMCRLCVAGAQAFSASFGVWSSELREHFTAC